MRSPYPELNLYWYWLQTLVLILPLNNAISPVAGMLLMGLFLIKRGWRELDTSINRGWLMLAGWLIVTALIAFEPSVAWTGLWNFLPFFLLFAIASFLIQTPTQFHHIAYLWVLSSIPVGLLGVVQAGLNQPDWRLPRLFGSYEINLGFSPDGRVASLFGHYNEAALYLAMVMPIACHFALGKINEIDKGANRTKQIWTAIALGLGIATIILTGSRNAWAIAAIGFGLLAIYYRFWYLVLGLSLGGGLVSWAAWGPLLGLGGEWLRPLFPGGFINRLTSAIDPSRKDYVSTLYRLDAWQFAVNLVQQHPIQGWGLRSFDLIAATLGHNLHGLPHEHNLYLAIAVGAGLPALFGFLGMLGWAIVLGLKAKLPDQTKGLVVVTVVAISLYLMFGILDVVFYEPRVNMLSWLLLAGVYGVSRGAMIREIS
ncbi:MAG: O-antigen ligase family protein [Pseudanabaena sp. CRU_2_10]|nr:O-antigen ligase family protein [Pseudanabaena sp. CRU_2_10]